MKCTFCKKPIKPGRGKIFVKTDGTILAFHSSKCEKNYFMKRDAKKLKWARK